MLRKEKNCGILSRVRKRKEKSMIQIIAYLSMLINHIFGIEIIGFAMPIFCYYIVVGMEKTRNKEKYIVRLLIVGCISQFFWPFKDDCYLVNDLLSMAITALAIQNFWHCEILKALMFISWLHGITAIEPLYLMVWAKKGKRKYYIGLIILVIFALPTYPYLLRWLLVPVLIELNEKKLLTRIKRLPKMLSYSIYPLHLMIMYLLR